MKSHTKELKKAFEDLFSEEIDEATVCTSAEHKIFLSDEKHIWQAKSRIPLHYEKETSNEIEKILRLGIITPSTSPWCSRIVLVRKKNGMLRMCMDYRPLNRVTIKDNYPLLRIDDILDAAFRARYFTTLDAISGYYQIPMNTEDSKKNSLWVEGRSV